MDGGTFLITGASRGIGAATARLAAGAGHRVALLARDAAGLHRLAEEIAAPDRVLAVPCDAADWDSVREAVGLVVRTWGRLDVAFANAGVSVDTSFLGTRGAPPPEWREMVLTNVYGPAIAARAALPELVRSRGHFVISGSAAGRGVRPGNLYAATKWAVTGLAQSIRAECVGTGVRVSLVLPGLVDTGGIPADRAGDPKLDPADVARAVLYAVGQPPAVDVNEILIRPVGQAPQL
ncbi:SDR family oxidoreductase [Allonocardiopsis opalescens]|uniref:NADP-dependent 3-hydroxy acid dehydrogenase YdfG n=1 Tax=Allonocardiopsis opalescens TaxID=1144618 RepID=A0A2T0PXS3_9ACTN|nr:SDR family NAD(P)-dependent oxidoreductase [Allonocardiopsis opalescens]PRX96333.1 NADP-dependent 3-hydroxy acid dehydrogenase YdfG [Allonocardiopsis opalescens]